MTRPLTGLIPARGGDGEVFWHEGVWIGTLREDDRREGWLFYPDNRGYPPYWRETRREIDQVMAHFARNVRLPGNLVRC